MHSVLVLMSTYNGEKYLREQLDSIIAQENVRVTILVRDDGSTDSTVEILEEYKSSYPETFILEKGENVGCLKSFFLLMKEAAEKYAEYDCYAFSDQDDVWLKDKLYRGADALAKAEAKYKLYFCAPQLVDATLKSFQHKLVKYNLSLAEAFVFQPCIGCSMIFNYALLKEAARGDISVVDIHDAWLYKLALSLGVKVIYDSTPQILYRQHSSNTIGSRQSRMTAWKRRWNWFIRNKRYRSSIARYILENYKSLIPAEEKNLLENLSNYTTSSRSKFKLLFNSDFNTSKRLHTLLFKFAIITNRI